MDTSKSRGESMSKSSNNEDLVRKTADEIRPPTREELDRLDSIRDEDIDLSDIPELTFPRDAQGNRFICISIDDDMARWLRNSGPEAAARVREALRVYMERHSSEDAV